MKVTCKTMAQEIFYVEATDNETVLDLKRKIETSKKFPVDSQRLVFSGQILRDEQTLGTVGLNEKSYIVVVVKTDPLPQKTTAKSVQPVQRKTLLLTPPGSVSFSNKSTAPKTTSVAQVWKTSPTVESVTGQCQPNVDEGSLMAMGYDMGQASVALTVCNNDTNLAAGLLLSGALQSAEDLQVSQLLAASDQREDLQAALKDPRIKPLLSAIRESDHVLDDALIQLKDSNPEMVQTIENNKATFLQMIGQFTEGHDKDHDKKDDEKEEKDDDDEDESETEKNEDDSEDDEDGAAKQAKKNDPPIVSVTTIGVTTSNGTTVDNSASAMFTEQDRLALERLKAMGFTDEAARLAYEVSNKNEQIAANYLLDYN